METVHYISSEKKKLLQVHHEFKNGMETIRTEMIAQTEFTTQDALRELIAELKISHPLPKEAIWMVCNEQSEYFAMVADI